ncbi:MAG: DUF3793 family protein [Planctomycetota bacterium]|jgi:hypothetical protein|nr:DUF3793 family protein [Planctomycetota bacterium]
MPASPWVVIMMRRLRRLGDADYLGCLIAYHASPTLAGMAPANLLRLAARERLPAWRENRDRIRRELGIQLAELTPVPDPLLLCYRPGLVRRALEDAGARQLLAEADYPVAGFNLSAMIERLGEKCRSGRFPHEVGLFLGYPPSEVRRFMRFGGAGAGPTGGWKAYGDPETARRFFLDCRAVKDGTARLLGVGFGFPEVADRLGRRAGYPCFQPRSA